MAQAASQITFSCKPKLPETIPAIKKLQRKEPELLHWTLFLASVFLFFLLFSGEFWDPMTEPKTLLLQQQQRLVMHMTTPWIIKTAPLSLEDAAVVIKEYKTFFTKKVTRIDLATLLSTTAHRPTGEAAVSLHERPDWAKKQRLGQLF